MNKVQLFQDRILTDAEQLALATGAAAYRWEDPKKAPVSPSVLLNPRRYGDGAKDLFITLNCVQENIIRAGQRDRRSWKRVAADARSRSLQLRRDANENTRRAKQLRSRGDHYKKEAELYSCF